MFGELTLLQFVRAVAITQGVFITVLASIIIIRYFKNGRRGPTGLMAWHILCIASSYLLLTWDISYEILNHWNQEHLSPRTPVALTAFALGDLGLMLMLMRQYILQKFIERK